MRQRVTLACSALALFLAFPGMAHGKKEKADLRGADLPQGVYGAIDGASRFSNADYYKFFLKDGIKSSDPKTLYGVIQDAIARKENYKALYLARLFTNIKPELAAGWSNRALIANSLGLKEEADACAVHAADPTSQAAVPLGVLPGTGLKVRPATLSDWAAAMALVGDSLSSRGGERFVVAVRDDISGVKVADPAEVKKNDDQLIASGLTPNGPYATANPVLVDQVGANLFVLERPEPMSYATVKKWKMLGGFAMAMASAYTGDANGAQLGGQMVGDAMEVDSNYKGGSYEKGTYDDASKMVTARDKPKSSGLNYAVGNPLTILWASGPSLQPNFYARWDTKKRPFLTEEKAGVPWDPKAKGKSADPPELYYPRLMSLCTDTCSVPVSALEAILTPSDLAKLAPSLASSPVNLDTQRQSYLAGKLTLGAGNANGAWVGFDDNGDVYKIQISNSQPDGWLVQP